VILVSIVSVVYGLMSLWSGRRIYKQCKIDAYKTALNRRAFQKNQDKYAFFSLFTGFFWPFLGLLAFVILTVKGCIWLVTGHQEIPAERQEKIDALEKELFPEDDRSN
jgi:hypothetical protein